MKLEDVNNDPTTKRNSKSHPPVKTNSIRKRLNQFSSIKKIRTNRKKQKNISNKKCNTKAKEKCKTKIYKNENGNVNLKHNTGKHEDNLAEGLLDKYTKIITNGNSINLNDNSKGNDRNIILAAKQTGKIAAKTKYKDIFHMSAGTIGEKAAHDEARVAGKKEYKDVYFEFIKNYGFRSNENYKKNERPICSAKCNKRMDTAEISRHSEKAHRSKKEKRSSNEEKRESGEKMVNTNKTGNSLSESNAKLVAQNAAKTVYRKVYSENLKQDDKLTAYKKGKDAGEIEYMKVYNNLMGVVNFDTEIPNDEIISTDIKSSNFETCTQKANAKSAAQVAAKDTFKREYAIKVPKIGQKAAYLEAKANGKRTFRQVYKDYIKGKLLKSPDQYYSESVSKDTARTERIKNFFKSGVRFSNYKMAIQRLRDKLRQNKNLPTQSTNLHNAFDSSSDSDEEIVKLLKRTVKNNPKSNYNLSFNEDLSRVKEKSRAKASLPPPPPPPRLHPKSVNNHVQSPVVAITDATPDSISSVIIPSSVEFADSPTAECSSSVNNRDHPARRKSSLKDPSQSEKAYKKPRRSEKMERRNTVDLEKLIAPAGPIRPVKVDNRMLNRIVDYFQKTYHKFKPPSCANHSLSCKYRYTSNPDIPPPPPHCGDNLLRKCFCPAISGLHQHVPQCKLHAPYFPVCTNQSLRRHNCISSD